jgi:hypothetical protein
MQRMRDAGRGAARGAGATLIAIASTTLVALGVPVFWVWVASQLAGTERELTPSLAIFITTGILVSYWVVLLIGTWVRGRWVGDEEDRTRIRRMSWNRSFRDEPSDGKTDPVERLFVLIAVIAFIAFEIWFFFFAGSPLPNQPLF